MVSLSNHVAISLRLNTRRQTTIATATRLPRCARNDRLKSVRVSQSWRGRPFGSPSFLVPAISLCPVVHATGVAFRQQNRGKERSFPPYSPFRRTDRFGFLHRFRCSLPLRTSYRRCRCSGSGRGRRASGNPRAYRRLLHSRWRGQRPADDQRPIRRCRREACRRNQARRRGVSPGPK